MPRSSECINWAGTESLFYGKNVLCSESLKEPRVWLVLPSNEIFLAMSSLSSWNQRWVCPNAVILHHFAATTIYTQNYAKRSYEHRFVYYGLDITGSKLDQKWDEMVDVF